MQKGKSAYCRSLMAHDIPTGSLFNDHGLQSWLNEFDLSITVERIQAKQICNVGHLLGYHAMTCNMENLADAIQMQDGMQNISVEIRSEFIKLSNNRNAPRTDKKVIQVYTAWDSASRAQRALVEIYSSQAAGAYPLGVQARFIPNVGDTRFIKTPKSLLAYTNSLKKHLKFMNSTETSPCYTIIEIDHFNPRVGMTLREAIMHIFSAQKPDCTLFVAVDTNYNGAYVQFAYRQELSGEAAIMISGLPLFLEAHLGHRLVWDWFTSDAREATANYRWDMNLGLVPIKKDAITNIKLHKWEHLDDLDEDEEFEEEVAILQPFGLLLEATGSNAYSDGHTITTDVVADASVAGSDITSVSHTSIDDENSVVSRDKPVPSIDSTATATTPSTITKPPDNDIALLQLMGDPEFVAKFQVLFLLQANKEAAQAAMAAPGTERNDDK
jgi:hypothetical protein